MYTVGRSGKYCVCQHYGAGAGQCFGYTVYEGMEGLADFDMIATADHSGLPMDYLMYEQSSLCCYWGDRRKCRHLRRKIYCSRAQIPGAGTVALLSVL